MSDSLVAGWLTELNLVVCIKTFRDEGIDSEALTGLDDAQLKVDIQQYRFFVFKVHVSKTAFDFRNLELFGWVIAPRSNFLDRFQTVFHFTV